MNVALIGSVSSTWYTLDALIKGGVTVTCVLGLDESQADRVSDYRCLRELARAATIPFHAFVKVSEPGVEQFLREHTPDMLWVIGLSQLIPKHLTDIAPSGGVGFHPTMLPEGRGRAPVAWTILCGARAAANLFCLTDEPDAGDLIAQREVPVQPDDYSYDLIRRTNEVLHDVILELAPAICAGNLPRTPQNHANATYYPKRTPADGLIRWSTRSDDIYRLIRAAGRPYPGAYTHANGRKIIVWRGRPDAFDHLHSADPPGTILRMDPDGGVRVRSADGAILVTEMEIENGGAGSDLLEVGLRLA